jgi:hypothetical protein
MALWEQFDVELVPDVASPSFHDKFERRAGTFTSDLLGAIANSREKRSPSESQKTDSLSTLAPKDPPQTRRRADTVTKKDHPDTVWLGDDDGETEVATDLFV